ncbi:MULTISPECIES: Fur family transcriptional regulator [Lactobacillaceae]|uniref:Transcriptional repressor n=1 Tax=Limosilactobacillus alvi TaxID=990412 RepID=A0ABS2ER97_9LACO|nr:MULTISPECIES: Fur family transcriptional regulator [Lactobacillaceae]MBM6754612.1 transcriptional repressor [Limosilactobacillus alvi]QLL69249.1 transcriptional repressor [Lactobacillus sp. 3B(2020)]
MNDDLKAQAIKALKQGHYRVTKQRQHLVDLLIAHPDHYLDITELDDQMRQIYPGISHNTIYRNLSEFQELGLVEFTRRTNGRAVKFSCERPHHHHFICQKCGKVFEIKLPPWDASYFEKQLPGAKITGHDFELYGLCADCLRQAETKEP